MQKINCRNFSYIEMIIVMIIISIVGVATWNYFCHARTDFKERVQILQNKIQFARHVMLHEHSDIEIILTQQSDGINYQTKFFPHIITQTQNLFVPVNFIPGIQINELKSGEQLVINLEASCHFVPHTVLKLSDIQNLKHNIPHSPLYLHLQGIYATPFVSCTPNPSSLSCPKIPAKVFKKVETAISST
ncbi:MAG: hypothetical protein K0S74_99 [Chlamydiales bacterium]|jgi:type II secretory pathway pseudopilin PulG|nr:hypothetical protein [Chlamydiales bacterium]